MKKLLMQIKEIALVSTVFVFVVGMMFFAFIGLEAWSRGFIW